MKHQLKLDDIVGSCFQSYISSNHAIIILVGLAGGFVDK